MQVTNDSKFFPIINYHFRGRGLACGISAGSVYIMNSVISKTFYNLETAFGLYGAMWFYCICTFLGFFIMYFILPETEGIPLADIEGNFSKKRIKIFADDPVTNFFRKQLKENYPTISTIDKESSAFRTNDITKF